MSMDDDDAGSFSPVTVTPHVRSSHPAFPAREDCWSEDATHTLIQAWGNHYIELNKGNLRQKHWQEVADAVNARHGHVKKARRTDIQCKNRIDTLKKKYKVEKARILDSGGSLNSQWTFFASLDVLIGTPPTSKKLSPPLNRRPSPLCILPLTSAIPVGPRSKRPMTMNWTSTATDDDSLLRRNFSAVAAAAAAVEGADADGSGSEGSRSSFGSRDRDAEVDVYRDLARAIERFGEIYEKVEGAKQRQMIELEKQRMQFVKDLEFQRMQLFVDTQLQVEKIKRAKRSSRSGKSPCPIPPPPSPPPLSLPLGSASVVQDRFLS